MLWAVASYIRRDRHLRFPLEACFRGRDATGVRLDRGSVRGSFFYLKLGSLDDQYCNLRATGGAQPTHWMIGLD